MTHKNILFAASILSISIFLSGCTVKQTGKLFNNPVSTNIVENSIQIKNFIFNPVEITVKPGTKIAIINEDSEKHSVVSDNGSFETVNIDPELSETLVAPIEPGEYSFHCNEHQYMKGTITVK